MTTSTTRSRGSTTSCTAVQVAPAMLGADGERRYFIAFTTPAETRGLGGFMGNWAELTANDGRLALADFGTTADLDHGGTTTGTGRTLDGPQEWLDLWGEFGFTSGPNGGTEAEPWSNVTVSPQFPSTGDVIAQLFPQSGGDEIDGVFAMDPYVLQAFLGLMGPITVEGSATELDGTNVADFLLVDQYQIDDAVDRVDLLAAVSQATAEQLLGGALPSPTVLADSLSPLAAQGRLVGWARDDEAQALLEAIHLSGELPDLAGGDGVAVVLNNAGGNRLDVYLQTRTRLRRHGRHRHRRGDRDGDRHAHEHRSAEWPARQRDRRCHRRRPGHESHPAVAVQRAADQVGDRQREHRHRLGGSGRTGAVRIRRWHRGGLARRIRVRRDPTGRVGHRHLRAGRNAAARGWIHARGPTATDRRRRAATPPRHLHRRGHPDRRIGPRYAASSPARPVNSIGRGAFVAATDRLARLAHRRSLSWRRDALR